jgi:hypothetical protein
MKAQPKAMAFSSREEAARAWVHLQKAAPVAPDACRPSGHLPVAAPGLMLLSVPLGAPAGAIGEAGASSRPGSRRAARASRRSRGEIGRPREPHERRHPRELGSVRL